jgi:hypothetical protein
MLVNLRICFSWKGSDSNSKYLKSATLHAAQGSPAPDRQLRRADRLGEAVVVHKSRPAWGFRRGCNGQFEWVETLLIAVLGIVMLIELMPIEIPTGMKTFVCGMPRSSGGGVQKRPEAAFLCIIETVVERLCRIGELL